VSTGGLGDGGLNSGEVDAHGSVPWTPLGDSRVQTQSPSPPVRHLPIDVINVREKNLKKTLKTRFLSKN